MEYINEMKKYIDIDIYGRYGDKHMPCQKPFPDECMEMDDYKFFLAFENSFCQDYVTEKPFKPFLGRRTAI